MAKKASGSKEKEKPKKVIKKETHGGAPNEISNEPKDSFDFGGLPNRDLKKNLGCG